jgi:hypothetical protein
MRRYVHSYLESHHMVYNVTRDIQLQTNLTLRPFVNDESS